MIEARVFCSTRTGPQLLMLGGVHGDEPCGTVALDRLAQELSSGQIELTAGRLTLVPRANPKAGAANERYKDINLNRVMQKHENPHHYEHFIANSICQHVDHVDLVLDLHAVTAPSAPFTFLDWDTPATRSWIKALNVPYALTGWDALYPGETGSTTISYANGKGKTALVVECGQKTNPTTADIAYRIARLTLAHLGLTGPYADDTPPAQTKIVRMTKVVWKETEGKLTGAFENFSPVTAGQVLAQLDNGSTLTADADGVIIMPKATAVMGEEWYYLAVPE